MYRWVDHTSELELHLEAPGEEHVFAAAVLALGELLAEREGEGAPARPASRELSMEARDRATLLAEWLAELAYLAEREGFVPEAVERLELGPGGLAAAVRGHLGAPPPLVKAVTYHRLAMSQQDDGTWRARVIFDV